MPPLFLSSFRCPFNFAPNPFGGPALAAVTPLIFGRRFGVVVTDRIPPAEPQLTGEPPAPPADPADAPPAEPPPVERVEPPPKTPPKPTPPPAKPNAGKRPRKGRA